MQDYPGRTKLWHVGVPPSGPMDALSFRLANALVGNPEDAAGLEITLSGTSCKAALWQRLSVHSMQHLCSDIRDESVKLKDTSDAAAVCMLATHIPCDLDYLDAGPTLKFHVDCLIALAGPEFTAKIDDNPVPFWTSILVKATSVLTIGMVRATLHTMPIPLDNALNFRQKTPWCMAHQGQQSSLELAGYLQPCT